MKTCCFSGHRKLPQNKLERMIKRLSTEIDKLISEGVTEFISGGALGFDTIAASLVIAKKEQGANIRLIFMLPCRDQDSRWTNEEKRLYRSLLLEADEIIYVSEEFSDDCMKKRNYAMVERAEYCICSLLHRRSGTSQTVDYAQTKGLKIINVAK